MAEKGSHPELEILAEFAAGEIADEEAAGIARHLAECSTCRLEVARVRRFEGLDHDERLSAEADWPRAEAALERGLDKILSAAPGAGGSGARRFPGLSAWRLAWAVPLAAAAVIAVLVLAPGRLRSPAGDDRGEDLLRGGQPEAALVPETPVGEFHGIPARFAWRAEQKFDFYTLEISTSDLKDVFRQAGITETTWVAPDTLRHLLKPGPTYVWNVQGFKGLTPSAVSTHAWFRIRDDSVPR